MGAGSPGSSVDGMLWSSQKQLPATAEAAAYAGPGAPPVAQLSEKGQVRLTHSGKGIFAQCG